ncbi:MAG: cadherin-like domain-containing protein, partial [Alphaproteobacteria bacterium]|nr:cadherin-like domain-containing protein [Alphaproteobacteria bacterium]
PVVTSASSANFAENGTGTAYAATAGGVGGSVPLTWSLAGADAQAFAINATTGAVSFITSPNFEAPTDADADNRYAITVVVTDGTTESRQNVTITVTDVLDTPVVTSATSANFAENGTGTAYAATAGGVGGSVPLTWSLAGADAQAFTIDAATGEVGFVAPPNFESPIYTDRDNRYAITVVVTDGLTEGRRDVAITVTGVNEAPVAGLAPVLATAALNTTRVLSTAELLDGFTDPENNPLQVSNLSSQNASFISNGQGGWTVSRLRDTDHRVDFTYTVSDSLGNQMLASNRLFFAVAGTIMGAPSGFDSILGGDAGENFMALRWFNTIRAGGGDDTIIGGEAAGRIYGEAGDDRIILRGTLNIAEGGAGNDTIDGSEGSSTINGGAGNDQLIVRGAGHVVLGEDGDDFIQGVGGGSRFDAGQGNNTIQVWGLGNEVRFADGNNVIQGADGNATMVGGHGGNLISLNGASNNVTLGHGDNAVFFGAAANAWLVAGDGRNAVQLRGWNNEVSLGDGGNVVWAGLGMSRITTGAGADQIFIGGSGGSDISVGAGDDVIYTGGAVNDVLRGGLGNDQYVLRHATNSIVELANQGIDTAWVEIDGYTLSAHVEIARLIAGATMLAGSAGHDVLVANQLAASTIDAAAGDDVIYGSPYADVLTGGAGNDIFYACAGQDRYIYAATGWGHDMIAGWESGAKLDMRGSGLVFRDLNIQAGPGFVLVVHGADMIQIFGIDRLTAGDLLFG